MKVWLPVYQYEGKYEVNVLDGIIREQVPADSDRENLLIHVPIEKESDDGMVFLGYGVVLVDDNNIEHLTPIDKIVAESILKRPINEPIYHKNGLSIDCNYKNLTLIPPKKSEAILRAQEAKRFYQYKRVNDVRTGHDKFVLDVVYDSYKDFAEKTGLTHADFSRNKDTPDRIVIGMYLWTFNELKTRGTILKSTPSQQLSRAY